MMIPDAGAAECYVYITLPGQTEAVTAGRFVIVAEGEDPPLGRFVYARSYLARSDAVELDPVELRLAACTYETGAMAGVFGALRDAVPDRWGRRVIEKHFGRPRLQEIDYLLQGPDDHAGALSFGLRPEPATPPRHSNGVADLEWLQVAADAIARDEESSAEHAVVGMVGLPAIATSMGGARPKTVVEDGEGLWVAKFNLPDDRWNQARIEHAMLRLGRECGLTTAESRVVEAAGRDVLLVRRFDREKTDAGYRRARMVSALTLLQAEDGYGSLDRWSYLLLAEELRRVCAAPDEQAEELFGRMCFNALISNIDDHPRNHAIIAKSAEWKLSPAYDLTPSTPISLESRDLALACGDQGRVAKAENLLSQCERFLLDRTEAEELVSGMEERVRDTWYQVARTEGVSERDCDLIKGAFVYPGFRRK